jgi:hypothetical protein
VLRVLPVIFVGCIIPPSLGTEKLDAGVNSPPAIVSVLSDQTALPEPGPVDLEVGQMSPLDLTLIDADVIDTLYVRVFVDYSQVNPTPPRSSCPGATTITNQETRTATCPLQGVCIPEFVGTPHLMQIMVFDRDPSMLDNTGEVPLYQAMPSGGLSTDRTYQLNCRTKSS